MISNQLSTDIISAFDIETTGDNLIPTSYFNIDVIEVQAKLPTVLYFRLNVSHIMTAERKAQLEDKGKFIGVLCDSWSDLSRHLCKHPSLVVVHCDTIVQEAGCVRKFFKMLNSLNEYAGNKDVPIAVVIEPTTTREFIAQLKAARVRGIVPSESKYSADIAAQAGPPLLRGEEYWPEHIINQLPSDNSVPTPINAYFRSDWETYFTPEIVASIGPTPWKTRCCATWNDLSKVLTDDLHQIVFHIDMITTHDTTIHEFVSMIETLIKCTLPNKKILLGVCIEDTTPLSVIKELKKVGVFGIVPSAKTFGGTEAYRGLDALFNKTAYWPKHILSQLPGNVKKLPRLAGIHLTDRQREVMELVCHRGLANKGVARMLKISESTVKIHLSAVMRAYGVRNRTQLALAVTSSLKA